MSPLNLSGSTGISGVDGSAGTPAIQGTDTNTGISFPAADTVAVNTGGSERSRVDSSGRLLVGTSTSATTADVSSKTQIVANGSDNLTLHMNLGAFGYGGTLLLGRSRNTSYGSFTKVESGDALGAIRFYGDDGTDYNTVGAEIVAYADAATGSNDLPTRLVFSTTANGASSPTEIMRLSSESVGFVANLQGSTAWIAATSAGASGSIPVFACRRNATAVNTGTDVFYVYSNGSYATISDVNQKKNIESTRDGYLEDLSRLRVVKYNWNDQEDTEPRELGLIAQEVEEVFPGLVSETHTDGAEPIKGIKYSVLPVMLLKALQEAKTRIETLEAEVAALKAQ